MLEAALKSERAMNRLTILAITASILIQGCGVPARPGTNPPRALACLALSVDCFKNELPEIRALQIPKISISYSQPDTEARQPSAIKFVAEVVLNERADSPGFQTAVYLRTRVKGEDSQLLERQLLQIPTGSTRGVLEFTVNCQLDKDLAVSDSYLSDEKQQPRETADFYFTASEKSSETKTFDCLAQK